MATQLGSVGIYCDAPTYEIVRATERLGFHSPLDVGWRHLRRYSADCTRRAGWFWLANWKRLLGLGPTEPTACRCGRAIPHLERCTFAFTSGREEAFFLGQCRRCRTIFWDEAD